MNNFGWVLFIILLPIGIFTPIYYIVKNGIKKTDFTKDKFMNFKIENGGISLIFLLLEIFSFGGVFYLEYFY